MTIIVQQDAAIYISVNRSTCFGWYLHPSSGGHNTVSTATCRERDWMERQSRSRQVAVTVLPMPDTVGTVT